MIIVIILKCRTRRWWVRVWKLYKGFKRENCATLTCAFSGWLRKKKKKSWISYFTLHLKCLPTSFNKKFEISSNKKKTLFMTYVSYKQAGIIHVLKVYWCVFTYGIRIYFMFLMSMIFLFLKFPLSIIPYGANFCCLGMCLKS